jgi:hypothetical protein
MIRTRRNKSLDREREKTDKHNLIARNKKEKQNERFNFVQKMEAKKIDLK